MNDYWIWIFAGIILGAFLWLKFRFFISAKRVKELQQSGAWVVDVRSESEFASDRVRGAKNFPLQRLAADIQKQCPDKDQVILCHCLSGSRSAFGVAQLRKLGYRNSYNLGSASRAHHLLDASS